MKFLNLKKLVEITVRTKDTGDKVFLVNKRKKTYSWIRNPETLFALGYSFSDVKIWDFNRLKKLKNIGYIDLVNEKPVLEFKEESVSKTDPVLGYKIEA